MSDEFESINSRIPDLQSALAARIAARSAANNPAALPPPGTVDPYKLMMQRKKAETAEIDPATIRKWPEEDVKALQDYCQKMGILGFNCGNMHPKIALAQLKKQCGDYTGVPLEDRIPEGYEKAGTPSPYGPNYPYSEAVKKRQILHG